MRKIKFANNATTTLAANISAVATTVNVTPGSGSKFPSLAAGEYFMATAVNALGNIEIMKVTARSGDSMTVERAAETVAGAATAYAFQAGDRFEMRWTAQGVGGELDRLDGAALPTAMNKAVDYTVAEADIHNLIRVDTGAAPRSITLPLISSLTDDFDIIITKVSSDSNTLTITASGTDKINGAAYYAFTTQWQSAWLIADRTTGAWTAINSGAGGVTPVIDSFIGDGSAGPFTLSGDPPSKVNTAVYVGGVYQQKSTYTLSGSDITLGGPVAAGVPIEVVWSQPSALVYTTADLVSYMPTGPGAVETTVQTKLLESISASDFGETSTITLNVPAQYASIQAALDFLAGKSIAAGTTVVIQVADGTHTLISGLTINHPQGAQIRLVGNPATPGNCVITVSGSPTFDALAVTNGYTLGLIDGFRFTLVAKATRTNNATAILATNGGKIAEVKNCLVDNWYYSIAARDGAYIYAHDCTTSNAGDVSVWAFCGGVVQGYNLTVSGANDSANNLGYGFQAEYGGVVDVTSSSATTCYRAGFAALSNGSGRYYNCTATANIGSGFVAQAGGVIEANGSSSTSNTRYGIELFGAGTCTGLSTNSGNTLGMDNGNLYIDQGLLGARLAANGNMRLDVNGANSVYFNSSGGAQAEIAHTAGAVNFPKLTGTSDTNVVYSANGAANDVDVSLQGKGAGFIFLGNNKQNYLRVNGQASGTAPQLRAEGVDPDIDLFLAGKGAGTVRFGTYTSSADVACNGYITIKDGAGTTRKLMTTA